MVNMIRTTLKHKVIEPQRRSSGKSPAVILLHGRGANEDDLLGLAEYFDERLFTISVRAPYPFQYGGGYAWYDILEVGNPVPEMYVESHNKIVQFVEDAIKGYPIDPSRIFFCGFSMGTIMSFSVLLTHPEHVAGVAANSGLIVEHSPLQYKWNEIKGKQVFLAHGTFDPVIPVQFARRAKELLDKAEAHVSYHEYEMGHQIDEESLNDLMKWLENRLNAPVPVP